MSSSSNKEKKIQKKRDIRKKLYEDTNIIEESDQEIEVSNTPTPVPTPTAESSPKDFYLPNHEVYQTNEQCDISTLQIGQQQNGGSPESRPQSPFSLKNYPAADSSANIDWGDLSRSSFIKPARFVYNQRNRIAQSSWVAGGYWHSKQPNPNKNETLSRSSSQSSGIGSLTSAAGLQRQEFVSSLPNSRVNSTCGELQERFSIFSEPAYKHAVNSTMISRPDSTLLFRSPSQLGDDRESLNSSLGRLSQEAFAKLQPVAESSPKETKVAQDPDVSFLEKKITINISVYSLFLFLSVAVNISLTAYLFSKYVWH